MFLRSIEIENLRAIRRAEIQFTDAADAVQSWTVLLGENGSGKSTILRAIALVTAGRTALPAFLVEPDSWIRIEAREARIKAVVETEKRKRVEFELTITRGLDISGILERNKTSLQVLDRAVSASLGNYFVAGYGVARRLSNSIGTDGQGTRVHPRFANVATLFTSEATLTSIESWATDIHYRRGKGGKSLVKTTLDGLLPDARFHDIDRDRRRILFKTRDGIVPLGQLSDGYQSVAAWTGDLLYRITQTFEAAANPLEARGVLLLDEMELHLHPVWQRELRKYLDERFPNLQVIATTHSALTAQQSAEGELWLVQRDASGIPGVHRYEGNPQRLQVQHLLLSDAFGLDSLSSPQVEAYRELKATKRTRRLRTSEETKLAELTMQLSDSEDPPDPKPDVQEMKSLLKRIDSERSKSAQKQRLPARTARATKKKSAKPARKASRRRSA